MILIVHTSL